MPARSILPFCCSTLWVLAIAACSHQSQSPEPAMVPASSNAETRSTPNPNTAAGSGMGSVPTGGVPLAADGVGSSIITVPLQARSGSNVKGTLTLTAKSGGTDVLVQVEGAKPGMHGIHFHEKPDCSAPDATSAGEHWNPGNQPHALPTSAERHLGDMGNMSVGQDGRGRFEFFIAGANLNEGDPKSLIGRALILHEKPDDGSQPSGNSGARVACTEIWKSR